jgi:8-hydroxy-5-deazaflavin:NADPH oxidoreductase
MKVGIVGAGKIGATAARLFVAAGHEVAISNSRGPESLRKLIKELGPRAHAMSVSEAAAFGDVVLLAVPWHIEDGLPRQELVRDKIVIDAMNPYRPEGGFFDLGDSTSSEEVLKRIPGAKLVKAFNTISYDHLATRGRKDLPVEERHAIYLAGNNPQAKSVVSRLIEEIGFAPVDTGSLREGGKLQQPDSFIFNQTFTAREARAFLRNQLHKLVDVLPEGALPKALEIVTMYKTWPPKAPQLSEGIEAFRKRVEQRWKKPAKESPHRIGRGTLGTYAATGHNDPEGNASYSSSFLEGDSAVVLSVRYFHGSALEITERIRFSEDKKRLLYTQEIKGPKGDEYRCEHEIEID